VKQNEEVVRGRLHCKRSEPAPSKVHKTLGHNPIIANLPGLLQAHHSQTFESPGRMPVILWKGPVIMVKPVYLS